MLKKITKEIPIDMTLARRLSGWDRSAFGVGMRRIEVLLVHGFVDKAKVVFQQLLMEESQVKHTINSLVSSVLPYRMANTLEKHGFKTLSSVHGTSDTELLRIPQLSLKTIAYIRAVISALVNEEVLPEYKGRYHESALEPDWPLTQEDLAVVPMTIPIVAHVPVLKKSEKENMSETTVSLQSALSTLFTAGDSAIVEIDAKIAQLNAQINQLKRVRKMLSLEQGNVARSNAGWEEQADRIIEVVLQTGPLKPKAIGDRIGVDFAQIGRVVKRTARLVKNGNGEVCLAD